MIRTILTLFIILAQSYEGFAQNTYTQGIAAAGDTTSAVVAFKDALNARREPARSSYFLGAIAFARGNVEEAITYLKMSLEADDESPEAYELAGDAHLLKNDLKSALGYYRRAALLAPMNAEVNLRYGKALLRADSLDAAIIQLSRAKIMMPKNPSIYEGLGDAYATMGIRALAINNYREGIKYSQKNIALRMKLARVYLDSRKYNDAAETFAAVEKIDSTYADAYLEQGRLYCRAKLYKMASKPLGNYIRLRPGSAEGILCTCSRCSIVGNTPGWQRLRGNHCGGIPLRQTSGECTRIHSLRPKTTEAPWQRSTDFNAGFRSSQKI